MRRGAVYTAKTTITMMMVLLMTMSDADGVVGVLQEVMRAAVFGVVVVGLVAVVGL